MTRLFMNLSSRLESLRQSLFITCYSQLIHRCREVVCHRCRLPVVGSSRPRLPTSSCDSDPSSSLAGSDFGSHNHRVIFL
jgi:hypothetical protein